MSDGAHPPTIQPHPPATQPRRARRIVGGFSFCAASVGGMMLAHMLSVLTSGGGLPGPDVAVAAFVYGIFVTAGAFLGYLGATDVLPLFPLREEGVFARWSAAAGLAAGALAGVVWTIADGILGGNGRGLLVGLPCAFVLGWVATQMLLGRAVRLEMLHPLSRTGKCAKCGYDLRATRAGRCPECGAKVR